MQATPRIDDNVGVGQSTFLHAIENTPERVVDDRFAVVRGTPMAVEIEKQGIQLTRAFGKPSAPRETVVRHVIARRLVERISRERLALDGRIAPYAICIVRNDVEAVAVVVQQDPEEGLPLAFQPKKGSSIQGYR